MEVFEEHLRARVGASRVVRPIDDDQRKVIKHLEAARHLHVRKGLDHELFRHRRSKERLDRRERHRSVVALMLPM